jgi:hypothetical protein
MGYKFVCDSKGGRRLKRTQLLGVGIVLMLTFVTRADFINGDFDDPIVQSQQWTAGVDRLGSWYGADYIIDGDGANLDYMGGTCSLSGARSLIQVLPMPEAGTYSWSLDNRLTEYNNQWSYWQVYLLNDDAVVGLTGGPAYGRNFTGATVISNGYAPADKDGGEWYGYTDQFTISPCNSLCYNYVGFVMTGSLYTPNQVLGFGNLATSVPVPEPMTLGLLAIGGYAILRRRAYM